MEPNAQLLCADAGEGTDVVWPMETGIRYRLWLRTVDAVHR